MRKRLAERLVEESVVLLKNENSLFPLDGNKAIAVFGRSSLVTYISGNGSGATRGTEKSNILLELEKIGIPLCGELKAYYLGKRNLDTDNVQEEFDFSRVTENINSGFMYEIFGKYHAPEPEYEVPETIMRHAATQTDTALIVIGRNSGGEECDRRLYQDYYLTDEEEKLIYNVCNLFSRVGIILNINGLIDLEWINNYHSIKSVLFIGLPGECGAKAVAKIIKGVVSPSGKLAFSIAHRYVDYPSAHHFSWDKENENHVLSYENYDLDKEENGSSGYEKSPVTVYQEDCFNGYRYFESFQKDMLFPFGHGLSYTTFSLDIVQVVKDKEGFNVEIKVKNTGLLEGKEVVQIYILPYTADLRRPNKELKGFVKTNSMKPNEECLVTLHISWDQFSCYNEGLASWMIERGQYIVGVGTSSTQLKTVCVVDVEEPLLISKCSAALGIKDCNKAKLAFLKKDKQVELDISEEEMKEFFSITEEDIKPTSNAKIFSEKKKKISLEDFTNEQLAAMLVGYGPGIPFAALLDVEFPKTICDEKGNAITTNNHKKGHDGYVSPAMEEKGINSKFYKDGPAGIGKIAWPTEMLLACSFNQALLYDFGNAIAEECEEEQVDVWLAPAVNLHRNPLCGRNFEYFSEDPYLTGICACAIANGVQENHNVMLCPKHFAINDQETYRRGSEKKKFDAVDSIITERAAREIYLKPFEMLVKNSNVRCMMTSFNKINGVFAAGNRELCRKILRDEWNFQGFLVTDWGDMDIVVDGADAVAAGNDIVMPGGPPVIKQILKGLEDGRLTKEEMIEAVSNFLQYMI